MFLKYTTGGVDFVLGYAPRQRRILFSTTVLSGMCPPGGNILISIKQIEDQLNFMKPNNKNVIDSGPTMVGAVVQLATAGLRHSWAEINNTYTIYLHDVFDV